MAMVRSPYGFRHRDGLVTLALYCCIKAAYQLMHSLEEVDLLGLAGDSAADATADAKTDDLLLNLETTTSGAAASAPPSASVCGASA